MIGVRSVWHWRTGHTKGFALSQAPVSMMKTRGLLGLDAHCPAGRRLSSGLGMNWKSPMTDNAYSCFILKILTSVFQDP